MLSSKDVLLLYCTVLASPMIIKGRQNDNLVFGTDPTLVVTKNGALRGSVNSNKTHAVFRGIPYAKPPLADLRWRPPIPAEAWEGALNATAFGATCIQPSSHHGDPGAKPQGMWPSIQGLATASEVSGIQIYAPF